MTEPAPGIDRLRLERGWIVGLAVIAIVLGLIGLFFPDASLLTVAILFGVYLVTSGVYRLTVAFTAHRLTGGTRWLTGILGGLVVVAGIVCLADPFASLQVLAAVIGIGWIVEGAIGLLGSRYTGDAPRWLTVASGIVSVLAGILMLILPVFGLATLVVVGAVLLIVLGVVALAELPRRSAR